MNITQVDVNRAPQLEVIEYAVYKNALVYLFKNDDKLRGGVLAITLSKEQYSPYNYSPSAPMNDALYVDINSKRLKIATLEDFKNFRVSSEYQVNYKGEGVKS